MLMLCIVAVPAQAEMPNSVLDSSKVSTKIDATEGKEPLTHIEFVVGAGTGWADNRGRLSQKYQIHSGPLLNVFLEIPLDRDHIYNLELHYTSYYLDYNQPNLDDYFISFKVFLFKINTNFRPFAVVAPFIPFLTLHCGVGVDYHIYNNFYLEPSFRYSFGWGPDHTHEPIQYKIDLKYNIIIN